MFLAASKKLQGQLDGNVTMLYNVCICASVESRFLCVCARSNSQLKQHRPACDVGLRFETSSIEHCSQGLQCRALQQFCRLCSV